MMNGEEVMKFTECGTREDKLRFILSLMELDYDILKEKGDVEYFLRDYYNNHYYAEIVRLETTTADGFIISRRKKDIRKLNRITRLQIGLLLHTFINKWDDDAVKERVLKFVEKLKDESNYPETISLKDITDGSLFGSGFLGGF